VSDLVRDVLFCLRCLRHPGEEPPVFLGIVFFFLMGLVAGVATAGALTVSEEV